MTTSRRPGGAAVRAVMQLRLPLLLRILSFSLLLAGTGEAQTASFKREVNQQVAAARRVAAELGVQIVDLASGETMYSYNPETLRILASNTKLFTTAAALDRLGPTFLFETPVLVRGKVEDGVLFGDLAVVGSGDPTISGRFYNGDAYGVFRPWARELKRLGIRRVAGELLLVHGLFDDRRIHPDWPTDQVTRWYEAPVDALSFNDNCVLLEARPTAPGRAARVTMRPELPIFRIASTAKTTSRSRGQWVRLDRRSGREDDVLTAAGYIYRRTEVVDKWITVPDPPRYFGAALRAALGEEGVTIDGASRPVETLPDSPAETSTGGWRRVLTHRTDLLTVLEITNKRSQNFYAECLIKLLGSRFCGHGTWENGVRAVSEFLHTIGLPGSFLMVDGSGMSRGNQFSPRQVTHLLRQMYEHRHGREYLLSLPYSGEADLRWEKRLATGPYRGNVFAKTGYLNGVSALSGYAKARSGKLYAFSILCNRSRSGDLAKAAEDRIVRALIDHG